MVSLSSKIISRSFTILVIILAFPATAIMASWNTIPGDFLYPVKRGLEKTALILMPNQSLESELRLKLLDRRTTEVADSITRSPGNTQSLNELVAEAQAAENNTTELEPEQKTQTTAKLITKLTQTSQELESVKNTVSQTQPINQNRSSPPPTASTTQTSQPASNQNNDTPAIANDTYTAPPPVTPQKQSEPETITPPAIENPPPKESVTTVPPPQITQTQAQETIKEIEQTQKELKEIIQELTQEAGQSGNIPPGQINNQNSKSEVNKNKDHNNQKKEKEDN